MSVSILHGTGRLFCDGLDKGEIEFSIALPADGPDLTKRGKLWGNKSAIGEAMQASSIRVVTSPTNDILDIEVDELDRDGSAIFTALATTSA
ncbi:hypothetical protein CES85_3473 (plasmid) [Ochrobactrum quorumnocens]|uniref:Uncharacterized protein n=1 Tax=Ochrobactrum quorumnocens TaxID=271865 RepID=A0A248UP75_9HYPH|nr:hypothetical protein [[Ochrobactrum] quorumnocens]ASV88653.1 hypothetical protein CES85_3473 [[Ochrobactrum] quorumnocens]